MNFKSQQLETKRDNGTWDEDDTNFAFIESINIFSVL